MRPFFSFVSRLRGLFALRSGQEFEQELDEHLKLLAARFEGQGMPPEDARYAARRQFGNLAQLKERHREARGIPFVEIVLRDLGSGLRQLRCRPGFSLIAITVLALGIGANTAIFSVVNGVLLHPLPFAHPERLVALFESDVVDNNPYITVAPANFLDWQKQSTTLEHIAATSLTSFNLSGGSKESGAEHGRWLRDFVELFRNARSRSSFRPNIFSSGRLNGRLTSRHHQLRPVAAQVRRVCRCAVEAYPAGWKNVFGGGRDAARLSDILRDPIRSGFRSNSACRPPFWKHTTIMY